MTTIKKIIIVLNSLTAVPATPSTNTKENLQKTLGYSHVGLCIFLYVSGVLSIVFKLLCVLHTTNNRAIKSLLWHFSALNHQEQPSGAAYYDYKILNCESRCWSAFISGYISATVQSTAC